MGNQHRRYNAKVRIYVPARYAGAEYPQAGSKLLTGAKCPSGRPTVFEAYKGIICGELVYLPLEVKVLWHLPTLKFMTLESGQQHLLTHVCARRQSGPSEGSSIGTAFTRSIVILQLCLGTSKNPER